MRDPMITFCIRLCATLLGVCIVGMIISAYNIIKCYKEGNRNG